MITNSDLMALADHHERQGLYHAQAACSNATWYHAHEQDTRRAVEHFAVAAAIRALPTTSGEQS